MHYKYVFVFLLIGLAQQSFALSPENEDPLDKYLNYADSAIQTISTVSRFSSSIGLTRGLTYCKTLFYNAVSDFGRYFELIAGFIPEATAAYKDYKECNKVEEPAALKVCKEATKLEYYDNVKTRFSNMGKSFRGVFVNLLKLPTCLLVKP